MYLNIIQIQQRARSEGKEGVQNNWVSGVSSCSSRGSKVIEGGLGEKQFCGRWFTVRKNHLIFQI